MSAEAGAARLKAAVWLNQPQTQALMAALDGAAGRTRAVGGIVRDTILELPRGTGDVDLATELLPGDVTRRAEAAGASVHPTGIEHGTVTVRLDTLVAEVTTLREDVETDGRRAVVRFGTDWLRDAARRDFTLNALYAGMDGTLFDPLGGLADCLAGRVRFIGDADRRIAEDRLRVYRFFRFSASHGGEQFDAEGVAACARAAGQLGTVSAERIGAEMRRLLGLRRVTKTLKAMVEAGVLGLATPTLALLLAYERGARHPDRVARLALILAGTDPRDLKDRWRLSNDEIDAATAILSAARLIEAYRLNEAAYHHPAALADGIEVAAVLAGWTAAGKAAVTEQLQRLDVPTFPLGGADLLRAGLVAGRELGAELERLERLWIASGFALSREDLIARIDRG